MVMMGGGSRDPRGTQAAAAAAAGAARHWIIDWDRIDRTRRECGWVEARHAAHTSHQRGAWRGVGTGKKAPESFDRSAGALANFGSASSKHPTPLAPARARLLVWLWLCGGDGGGAGQRGGLAFLSLLGSQGRDGMRMHHPGSGLVPHSRLCSWVHRGSEGPAEAPHAGTGEQEQPRPPSCLWFTPSNRSMRDRAGGNFSFQPPTPTS